MGRWSAADRLAAADQSVAVEVCWYPAAVAEYSKPAAAVWACESVLVVLVSVFWWDQV